MFVFDQQTQYALFKGVEQEGSMKGTPTLFVHKKAPRHEIEAALAAHSLHALYFGAGFLSEHSAEDARYFISQGYFVTVESIEIPEVHEDCAGSDNYLWMCPIVWQGKPTKNLERMTTLPHPHQILVKIDTGHSTAVLPFSLFFTSEYADYSGDEMLVHVKDNT